MIDNTTVRLSFNHICNNAAYRRYKKPRVFNSCSILKRDYKFNNVFKYSLYLSKIHPYIYVFNNYVNTLVVVRTRIGNI